MSCYFSYNDLNGIVRHVVRYYVIDEDYGKILGVYSDKYNAFFRMVDAYKRCKSRHGKIRVIKSICLIDYLNELPF